MQFSTCFSIFLYNKWMNLDKLLLSLLHKLLRTDLHINYRPRNGYLLVMDLSK